jgi:hypothetical protein
MLRIGFSMNQKSTARELDPFCPNPSSTKWWASVSSAGSVYNNPCDPMKLSALFAFAVILATGVSLAAQQPPALVIVTFFDRHLRT